MRSLHRILAAGALALVAAVSPASPAVPAASAASSAAAGSKATLFLKIDGIPGDSTARGHAKEIELLSFSFGADNSAEPGSGGGGGAGKVTFHDLTVTKHPDVASPKLFDSVVRGTHIPTATLTVARSKSGSQNYYVIVLKDVIISSFQTGGTGGQAPVEQVALAYVSATLSQG